MADRAAFISGHLTVRPVRVGLLIRPGSESDFERAIELATSSWGGITFPLIPVEDATAAIEYAESVDVDVLAAVSDDEELRSLAKRPGFDWRTIDDRGPFERRDATLKSWVLGAEALLGGQAAHGKSNTWLHVTWSPHSSLSKLNLVLFGRYGPGRFERDLERAYLRLTTPLDLGDGAPLPEATPTRSQLGLTRVGLQPFDRDPTVVVVDPSNVENLSVLWNLRALGADVVPWVQDQETIVERAISNWLSERSDSNWTRLGSENVINVWSPDGRVPSDLGDFLRSRLPTDVGIYGNRLGLPGWIERGAAPETTTYSRSFSVNLPPTGLTVEVPLPPMDLLPRRLWYNRAGIVAVDVSVNTEWELPAGWRAGSPTLRQFGSYIRSAAAALEQFIRPTDDGFVIAAEATSEVVRIPFASSLGLIDSLLKPLGYTCSISDSGRYSARLIEVLGGAYPDSAANQPAMRAVLNKAVQSEFGQPPDALIQIAKDASRDWDTPLHRLSRGQDYAQGIVEWLTFRKALRPRLKLPCMACGSTASLPPEDLSTEIRCELCGEVYPLALSITRKRRPWLLAVASVLPLQRLSETYPIMATISAIAAMRSPGRHLPHHVVGLELERRGERREFDLVFLLQNRQQPAVVVGESKNYASELDADDFAKLESVQTAIRSTGIDCYLLISTMREALSAFEIQELRRICDTSPAPLVWEAQSQRGIIFPIILREQNLSVPWLHEDHPGKLASGGWRTLSDLAVATCKAALGLRDIRYEQTPGGDSRPVPSWDAT